LSIGLCLTPYPWCECWNRVDAIASINLSQEQRYCHCRFTIWCHRVQPGICSFLARLSY
jgi:hypothetical protein